MVMLDWDTQGRAGLLCSYIELKNHAAFRISCGDAL